MIKVWKTWNGPWNVCRRDPQESSGKGLMLSFIRIVPMLYQTFPQGIRVWGRHSLQTAPVDTIQTKKKFKRHKCDRNTPAWTEILSQSNKDSFLLQENWRMSLRSTVLRKTSKQNELSQVLKTVISGITLKDNFNHVCYVSEQTVRDRYHF